MVGFFRPLTIKHLGYTKCPLGSSKEKTVILNTCSGNSGFLSSCTKVLLDSLISCFE